MGSLFPNVKVHFYVKIRNQLLSRSSGIFTVAFSVHCGRSFVVGGFRNCYYILNNRAVLGGNRLLHSSASFCPSPVSGFGFGCDASSKSLAESLSVRAASTGPKTFAFNFWLLALFVLALALLAIISTL